MRFVLPVNMLMKRMFVCVHTHSSSRTSLKRTLTGYVVSISMPFELTLFGSSKKNQYSRCSTPTKRCESMFRKLLNTALELYCMSWRGAYQSLL